VRPPPDTAIDTAPPSPVPFAVTIATSTLPGGGVNEAVVIVLALAADANAGDDVSTVGVNEVAGGTS